MRKLTEEDLKEMRRQIRAGERLETYEPKIEKNDVLHQLAKDAKTNFQLSVTLLVLNLIFLIITLIR